MENPQEYWRARQPELPRLGDAWDIGREFGISGRLVEEWQVRYDSSMSRPHVPPQGLFPPPVMEIGGRGVWLADQVHEWHTWMLDNDPAFAAYRTKRAPHQLTAWGETKTYAEWLLDSRCPLVYVSTLTGRLGRGWAPERAVSTPVRSVAAG